MFEIPVARHNHRSQFLDRGLQDGSRLFDLPFLRQRSPVKLSYPPLHINPLLLSPWQPGQYRILLFILHLGQQFQGLAEVLGRTPRVSLQGIGIALQCLEVRLFKMPFSEQGIRPMQGLFEPAQGVLHFLFTQQKPGSQSSVADQ